MNSVIKAFSLLALIFTLFQFVRLFIDFGMLEAPNSNLMDTNSFFVHLKKTKWFQYVTILDYVMILIGTLVLGIEMYIQENRKNSFEIVCLSGIFVTCYVVILI
ncbi:MAG: hypothetical protein ACWIPI_04350 [Polaribacter sp.]